MIRPWPRSLAAQLIVLLLLAVVVAQAAGLAIFVDERRRALLYAHREQVLARMANIVRVLHSTPAAYHAGIVSTSSTPQLRFWLGSQSALAGERTGRHDRRLTDRLRWHLGNPANTPVAVDVSRQPSFLGWEGLLADEGQAGRDGDGRHHDGHGRRWRALSLTMAVALPDGRWVNARTLVPPRPPGWAAPSLVALAIAAVAICLVVVLVVRRTTRPLRRLAEAAAAFGRGDRVGPLDETGALEVRRTTRAFNDMQARIRRFVDDRMRLLAAISHDLRTPLTTLRLRAEMIDDPATRERITDTVAELQRMTEALLAFAREEASQEATHTVDLGALVESIVADYQDLGSAVDVQVSAKLAYPCRPVAMKRALRNIVDNALNYGARAHVFLDIVEGTPSIRVEDEGPGIPEADRERIFEPFVRLEASRSRETGGTGLGLAIARAIVRAHGGEITLTNRDEGGLRVTITLPAPAPRAARRP